MRICEKLSGIYEMAVTATVITTCRRDYLKFIVEWKIILEYKLNTCNVHLILGIMQGHYQPMVSDICTFIRDAKCQILWTWHFSLKLIFQKRNFRDKISEPFLKIVHP